MNNRRLKTLAAVFADPVKPGIAWEDIEALLVAIGCEKREGAGSRVRFMLRGLVLAVHRPHPRKEAKPYQLREVRGFLEKLGIRP